MTRQTIARLPLGEREKLIEASRRAHDAATSQRLLIVAKLASGDRQSDVARALIVARSTVSFTLAKYHAHGCQGLYDQRRRNGQTKVDQDFLDHLCDLLLGVPSDHGWQRTTWSRELLSEQMEMDGFPRVSLSTMGRSLRKVGARQGNPKPVVSCPWSAARRERRIRKIRALEPASSAREPLLYADEVDIHLNPRVGPDWMLPGGQRLLLTPGENEKFYIAGALDFLSGRLITTGAAQKNGALFCNLLDALAAAYPKADRIHLVLDNFGIHKCNLAQSCIAKHQGRIVLHFLPPYCPDFNRIERVWRDLHACVTRNHRCRSMRELLSRVRDFVDAYLWHAPLPKLRLAP
jgi:transposase